MPGFFLCKPARMSASIWFRDSITSFLWESFSNLYSKFWSPIAFWNLDLNWALSANDVPSGAVVVARFRLYWLRNKNLRPGDWSKLSCTGLIKLNNLDGYIIPKNDQYFSEFAFPNRLKNITNLKNRYRVNQKARFNLYIRDKNWSPTIYTVANSNPPATIIESASYKVYRVLDGLDVIPYGTGSDLHTMMSYDVSGNYFDLSMKLLEPGYEYAFKFSFYDSSLDSWTEQNQVFKFRVEDYEY